MIGVTVILVDVTPLRRADEAKSSMVLTVSHELRTPLTGMRMALSLLSGNKFGPVTEQQKSLIATAREDSERLHRIIENLLNISRLEAGRAQLQFRRMKLADMTATALDALRPGFLEKKITVEVNVSPDLPDVNADPLSIGSAMTNLLSNAMKFTPVGGSVRVSGAAMAGEVLLAVADSGPGIPKEYSHRIFEKFFRVPHVNGPTGAGLGLTIAREIIEAHGGQLTFDSQQGAGTTFKIVLPVMKDSLSTSVS